MDQKVTLIDKKSHQGIEVNASGKIQLSAQNPSVVQLKISSEDIKEYKKKNERANLAIIVWDSEYCMNRLSRLYTLFSLSPSWTTGTKRHSTTLRVWIMPRIRAHRTINLRGSISKWVCRVAKRSY